MSIMAVVTSRRDVELTTCSYQCLTYVTVKHVRISEYETRIQGVAIYLFGMSDEL